MVNVFDGGGGGSVVGGCGDSISGSGGGDDGSTILIDMSRRYVIFHWQYCTKTFEWLRKSLVVFKDK